MKTEYFMKYLPYSSLGILDKNVKNAEHMLMHPNQSEISGT